MAFTKRKGWIDIARAFAMIFVIFVHIGNELVANGLQRDTAFNTVTTAMNPIKIPLFFMISGFLFSVKNKSCRHFMHRELRTRLIPYLIWGSFMGIVGVAMDLIRSGFNFSNLKKFVLSEYVLPLVRGNLIWFVPCLFVVEVLFFCLLKISKQNLLILSALAAVCTVAGYYLSSERVLPWKVDTALTSLQFMTFGYLLKNAPRPAALKKCFNSKTACVGLGAFYLLLLLGMNALWPGVRVDVNRGQYFHPAGFTLLALVGALFIITLSMAIQNNKLLEFIGKNSLTYFIWHMYIAKAVIFVLKQIGFIRITPMCVTALLTTAVSCLAVAAVCRVINKYFGISVGLKRE